MSSAMSMHACSSSTHQPRIAKRQRSVLVGVFPWLFSSSTPVSTTMSPRFILPPRVLYSSDRRTHSTSFLGNSYIPGNSSSISLRRNFPTFSKEPLGSFKSYSMGYSVVKHGFPAGQQVAGLSPGLTGDKTSPLVVPARSATATDRTGREARRALPRRALAAATSAAVATVQPTAQGSPAAEGAEDAAAAAVEAVDLLPRRLAPARDPRSAPEGAAKAARKSPLA
mmetsp:Transcript_98997/g.284523  ORF Transcript_98997/g.284523 Transcript_98997/m.284523 type:complete len:225 (+) Transcript_98997:845-1519(+)